MLVLVLVSPPLHNRGWGNVGVLVLVLVLVLVSPPQHKGEGRGNVGVLVLVLVLVSSPQHKRGGGAPWGCWCLCPPSITLTHTTDGWVGWEGAMFPRFY